MIFAYVHVYVHIYIWVYIYIWAYMYAYGYIQVYVPIYAFLWRSKLNVILFFRCHLSTCSLRYLWDLVNLVTGQGALKNFPSPPLEMGVELHPTTIATFAHVWGLNRDPHACTASISLTEHPDHSPLTFHSSNTLWELCGPCTKPCQHGRLLLEALRVRFALSPLSFSEC